VNSSSANANAFLQFRNNNGSAFRGIVGYNASTGDINLSEDGSVAAGINVNSSGNVGIGTTNPTSFGGGSVLTEIHGTTTYGALLASTNTVTGELFASEGGEVYVGSRTNHVLRVVVNNSPKITIDTTGNVGIGTTSPGYLLDVAGQVHATSFVSSTQTYADFVFKPGYKLPPLSDVEASIQKDGHLPGIPSEAEAKAHGIDLASMQVKLLQKIEELTLHVISQEKRLDEQNGRIERLEKENAVLCEKVTK
jgi:hypothetical protein